MTTSRLFSPKLRAAVPTVIEGREHARIFMNPPTHPEIPVFDGPTGDGTGPYPLQLTGTPCSTPTVKRAPVSSKPQEEERY